MSPFAPSCCSHAILAKRVPSGQGERLPDCAALIAISFPRIKRKVLLSPRSVKLIGRHFSKAGSKGKPFSSGLTAARDTGVDAASRPTAGAGSGRLDQGERYVFRAANSSGVTLASG